MESESKSQIEKRRIELENKFCELLRAQGINFASGVPCGVQKYIISNLSNDPKITHIPATRESEAIGIAAGACLAGKKPVVYMQNSGLMDSINDITSLLIPYKIPVLLLVSWRGTLGEDAPQHLINGKSTIKILDAIEVPAQVLTKENMNLVVSSSKIWMEKQQTPAAILVIREVLK